MTKRCPLLSRKVTYLECMDCDDKPCKNIKGVDNLEFLAIIKAFDKKLCGEWHSGSCTYYKSKCGFKKREEAEEFLDKTQCDYYKNDIERYSFSRIILSYDSSEKQNVEEFFKYM